MTPVAEGKADLLGARVISTSLFVLLLLMAGAGSTQTESYDYHQSTQRLVDLGTQAFMICNGIFTSGRSLEQIYEQELKLNRMPLLPPRLVNVDEAARTVAVGGGGNLPLPAMRAAYRTGLGCVVMAPDQTFDDVDELPELRMTPFARAEARHWPDGDLLGGQPPEGVDKLVLEAAADWAFDRAAHGGHASQDTLSLVVVYEGKIVLERYAPGIDVTTRTRTWSTAKSIASTIIGIAIDEGRLELDQPITKDGWGTGSRSPVSAGDPRLKITLRDVLHMSSGLYPVDNQKCSVVGSCLAYFAGTSAVRGALDRGLVHPPGTVWDYENDDTLLALFALRRTFDSDEEYLEYPRRVLLDRIGMISTVPGVDRFGDYVMSSQVYTNARDLARLGLLYLNRGRWGDKQILSEEWVDFVRTPAPSTASTGNFYGGQFWLVPDDRDDVPADAYSTAGNRGQYTVIVPSYDLVIVRRGLDWLPGQHRFSQWDLTREVIKALPERPWGEKPRVSAPTTPSAGAAR